MSEIKYNIPNDIKRNILDFLNEKSKTYKKQNSYYADIINIHMNLTNNKKNNELYKYGLLKYYKYLCYKEMLCIDYINDINIINNNCGFILISIEHTINDLKKIRLNKLKIEKISENNNNNIMY